MTYSQEESDALHAELNEIAEIEDPDDIHFTIEQEVTMGRYLSRAIEGDRPENVREILSIAQETEDVEVGEVLQCAEKSFGHKENFRRGLDDPDHPDHHGPIPVMQYAQSAAMVQTLAEAGARMDGALHSAANAEVAQALIDAGADVHDEDRTADIPEVPPLVTVQDPGAAQVLIDNGAELNKRYGDIPDGPVGQTPLEQAAKTGNVDKMRVLLDNGADPNKYAPLLDANDRETAETLLAAGANPTQPTKGKPSVHSSVLQETVNLGKMEVMQAMLDHGADPNIRDQSSKTPLYHVRNADQVESLLQAGADPTVRDQVGRTPAEHLRDVGKQRGMAKEDGQQEAYLIEAHQASQQAFQAADLTQSRRRGSRSRGGGAEQDVPSL